MSSTFDFARFRAVIAGLHHALQNTDCAEQARAALLLQTANPAHSYDLMQFMNNLACEVDGFDQALMHDLDLHTEENGHGH
jgi:hypothetical protein